MNAIPSKAAKNVVEVGSFFENMALTRKHFLVGFTLFFAFVVEAWEMMLMIFISGSIASEFHLSKVQVGSLIGSLYLGMIPGIYFWGYVMDILGRKKTIIWGLLLYGALSLISAFSTSYAMLYTLRLLAGFAMAGVVACVFPYFTEVLPVKYRGRATVFLSTGWPLGTMLATGITALLIDYEGIIGGWRGVIFVSSLACLWALVVAKIPESPYWLIGKGDRQEEAKRIIEYLSEGKIKVSQDTRLEVFRAKTGSYLEIFNKQFYKMTILQTVANFAFAFGYWGLFTWIPTLLAQKGLSLGQSLGFVTLSALFQIPGYLASSYLTGKYGRKKVMISFVLLAAISGFAFAYSSNMVQLYVFNFALSFFSLGAWGVWNTWYCEIYPTRIRGTGHAFGSAGQRWANMIAPTLIGFVIGLGWSFDITVSFIQLFIVVTVICCMFLPETEGKILQ